jgi:Domain of unknown function (DUF4340)
VWPVAAIASAGVLVAIALHGERAGAGFARYEPEGVMVRIRPAEVSAVELSAPGGQRWRFVRSEGEAGGWRTAARPRPRAGADADGAPSEDIQLGLRFLHGSAPQRVMAREELAGTPLSELGLAPPRLAVSVFTRSDGEPFVIELGAPNPQGLARYARVAGSDAVVLLNRYVAEAWEKAAR